MTFKRILAVGAAAAIVAACESGDVNLQPTNVDNSTSNGGNGGSSSPCAAYVDPDTDVTRQGSFDGTNCTYDTTFVSFSAPIKVNLEIPFISGVHIFQDTLAIGENVSSGAAPAGGEGPVLSIDAGSTLAFSDSADYLLINRGSQIIAQGSPTAPITITSFTDAVTGTASAEAVQQWGGLVINGNGITNNCTDAQRASSDCHVVSEGQPSHYGGNDNADNSGVLRYLVVKHTGFEAAPGDELNGITFNAVGSGTQVSHIQTYSTFDDGIEFFGGAVNVDHFVALYVRDDSVDFSDGYVGTIDRALVIHSQLDGNRCVEGDGIGEGRADNQEPLDTPPLSNPTITNMTCILSNSDAGTHDPSEGPTLRRGSQIQLASSIVYGGYANDAGADNECFEISDEVSLEFAASGSSTVINSLLACQLPTNGALVNGDSLTDWILNTGTADYSFNVGNVVVAPADLSANANVEILDCFYTPIAMTDENAAAITFVDGSGAPLTVGAVTRDDDWTANWTYGLHDGIRAEPLWFEGIGVGAGGPCTL